MDTYVYNGPVYLFDKLIDRDYVAVTTAKSEAKAKSNLEYRYKMQNGYGANSRIRITGEIKKVS